MTHVFVRHKVNDFNKWKKTFDDFADFRRSSGEKSYQVMQQDKDSNNLFLMFEWDTEANARKFFDSKNLQETMQKAGVAEAPDINFLNEADHGRL
jgi:quinol monooxygenase YgiN